MLGTEHSQQVRVNNTTEASVTWKVLTSNVNEPNGFVNTRPTDTRHHNSSLPPQRPTPHPHSSCQQPYHERPIADSSSVVAVCPKESLQLRIKMSELHRQLDQFSVLGELLRRNGAKTDVQIQARGLKLHVCKLRMTDATIAILSVKQGADWRNDNLQASRRRKDGQRCWSNGRVLNFIDQSLCSAIGLRSRLVLMSLDVKSMGAGSAHREFGFPASRKKRLGASLASGLRRMMRSSVS